MVVDLFGHNPTPGIVSVQHLNDQTIRLYTRSNGKISHHDAEFFPFFFLSDVHFLKDFPHQHWLKELGGNQYYKYLAVFSRWNEMWEAIRFVLQRAGSHFSRRFEHYTDAEFLLLRPDPITQYLMQSGITLFKGMKFEDLHRVQLSLEALSSSYKFPDARKTDDHITVIALSDNRGWEEVLDARKTNERALLEKLIRIIVEKDPDIIEGHFLFENDLPYLLKRCEMHGLELGVGRDGSSLRTRNIRGTTTPLGPEPYAFDVVGRHLLDTAAMARAYEGTKHAIEDFSLAALSQHYNLALDDRIYLPSLKMSWHWKKDPRLVIRYALDNVRETKLLGDRLGPQFFTLAQICPLTLDSVVRSGSALKIESLMLREYIRHKHSVPKPEEGSVRSRGYADIFFTGMLDTVIRVEVESFFSSIMVSRTIEPRSDELGIFHALLAELARERLNLKQRSIQAASDKERDHLNRIQSSFAILENSFYGYLGYSRGLFNDYLQVDRVTSEGQEILQAIMKQIDLFNGTVVQVDTDSIHFVVPDNIKTLAAETALVKRLSGSLPDGIYLSCAGRYKNIFSYRKKNYAARGYDDKVLTNGTSLIPRNLEFFARRFLLQAIHHLLTQDIDGLHRLYVSTTKAIQSHQWDVTDFSKTETVRESIDVYARDVEKGIRKPSPLYELLKRSGVWVKPGSRVEYYVTGNGPGVKISDHSKLAEEWNPHFPDENTAYYLSRLEECAKKLESAFLPDDFRKIFSMDDLFGFHPEQIKMISRPVEPEDVEPPPDSEEQADFSIWLADGSE